MHALQSEPQFQSESITDSDSVPELVSESDSEDSETDSVPELVSYIQIVKSKLQIQEIVHPNYKFIHC